MSEALFFIFCDEAGRTTYLHLVKNQNNSINSKQATQKTASIWALSMRCPPPHWPDRNQVGSFWLCTACCSRSLQQALRSMNIQVRRAHGGAPSLALSGQLPSQISKNDFSVSTHWALETHTAHWVSCCCFSAPIQPVDAHQARLTVIFFFNLRRILY